MPATTTLTAVDVDVSIEGDVSVKQGTDIVVASVSITNRVNDFSEAQIALGYKTKAGLEKLRRLFPFTSSGAHFAKVTVTLKPGGPKSNIKKNYTLFEGLVLGFSHQKSSGQINFVLNARGGIYQLSQILIASPGFHPSSPVSWGIAAMSVEADATVGATPAAFVEDVVTGCKSQPNAVEMYKCICQGLIDQWVPNAASGLARDAAYAAAIRAFGFGDANKNVVLKELEKVIIAGSINSKFFDETKESDLLHLVMSAMGNGQMSFWDLFLHTIDAYGLDVLMIANKAFVIAKNPLVAPIKNNIIIPEDEAQISISDFPFTAPTRCIVTNRTILDSNGPNGPQPSDEDIGIYPDTDEPTTQEQKTGVKTILVQAPSYLAYLPLRAAKPTKDVSKAKQTMVGVAGKKIAYDIVSSINLAIIDEQAHEKAVADQYAQYVLMKAKFKQRTGVVVSRLNPELLPGFPGRIVDPLNVATLECYIDEVTHVLDYQGAQARTEVSLSYIRYSGELDPNPFSNPIYPDYDMSAAASQVLSEISK